MIRDILSQAITDIANVVLPNAKGDKWRNDNFIVMLPNLQFINPTTMDEKWRIVAEVKGTAFIRVFSDSKTPIDLTPLVISLREHPIIINPEMNINIGEYSVKLFWKPDYIKDEFYDGIIVPYLGGEIKHSYIVQKDAYFDFNPTEIFMFFPNRCPHPQSAKAVPINKMLMTQLKQRKIGIHTSLENAIFALYPQNNLVEYTVSGENVLLGKSANEFNESGSIQILLNGRILEKGVTALYIDQYCFKYQGIVDQGDYFVILTP